MEFDVFAATPLFLTDTVVINLKVLEVADAIQLVETIGTNQWVESVEDVLLITDSVAINRTTHVIIADSLSISDIGQRQPIIVSVADGLIMWQSGVHEDKFPGVFDTLTFTDDATQSYSAKGLYDTLALMQSVIVTKTIAVLATNTLAVSNLASVYKPTQFWTIEPIPPPITPQKVTFTFKGKEYKFRRPQMGNQDQLSFQRISRKSRGGDLIVYRDAEWPKTEVQIITFDFNTDAELRAMKDLINLSLGTFMTYLDHENKTWLGFIQNPDAEAVCQGRNHYTITINFEGDLQ